MAAESCVGELVIEEDEHKPAPRSKRPAGPPGPRTGPEPKLTAPVVTAPPAVVARVEESTDDRLTALLDLEGDPRVISERQRWAAANKAYTEARDERARIGSELGLRPGEVGSESTIARLIYEGRSLEGLEGYQRASLAESRLAAAASLVARDVTAALDAVRRERVAEVQDLCRELLVDVFLAWAALATAHTKLMNTGVLANRAGLSAGNCTPPRTDYLASATEIRNEINRFKSLGIFTAASAAALAE